MVQRILEAKARRHRSYVHVNEDDVRKKALQLPKDDIPAELTHLLPNDGSISKLQIQKAATPVEGMRVDRAQACKAIASQRPNAVVLEKTSCDDADDNEQRCHALNTLASQLQSHGVTLKTGDGVPRVTSYSADQIRFEGAFLVAFDSINGFLHKTSTEALTNMNKVMNQIMQGLIDGQTRRRMLTALKAICDPRDVKNHRLVVATGSSMLNQYEPWYFGVAFAFCFKFCTGMPDAPEWIDKPRHRRVGDAPRIELDHWVKVISRRVEQQLKRDWLLGFSMGSLLFTFKLNTCRTVYSYQKYTAKELEDGAIAIATALAGKYRDIDGKVQRT